MSPELLFASLGLWLHTVRDVLQHGKRHNLLADFMHPFPKLKAHQRSELPTACLTASLGVLCLLWGL